MIPHSTFHFSKEKVLPSSDPRSPFYYNLPPYDSKPIDNLIEFFKLWKYFIKSIIYYFKEILLVKELEANLNYQLISAVQFPGCKDLPNKILQDIKLNTPGMSGTLLPKNQTPTKEVKRNLSSSSLSTMNSSSTVTPVHLKTTTSLDKQRPGLFKSKSNSNQSCLKKSAKNFHKRK